MKFELFRDRGGNWRWRLRSRNGRITAASGEAFASRYNARRAARRVGAVLSKA